MQPTFRYPGNSRPKVEFGIQSYCRGRLSAEEAEGFLGSVRSLKGLGKKAAEEGSEIHPEGQTGLCPQAHRGSAPQAARELCVCVWLTYMYPWGHMSEYGSLS